MAVIVGQDVRIVLVATKPDGTAANPNSVRFKLKNPTGTVTTHTLGANDSVQQVTAGTEYTFTFDAAQRGRYIVRAEVLDSQGAVFGASEMTVLVNPSKVA